MIDLSKNVAVANVGKFIGVRKEFCLYKRYALSYECNLNSTFNGYNYQHLFFPSNIIVERSVRRNVNRFNMHPISLKGLLTLLV